MPAQGFVPLCSIRVRALTVAVTPVLARTVAGSLIGRFGQDEIAMYRPRLTVEPGRALDLGELTSRRKPERE